MVWELKFVWRSNLKIKEICIKVSEIIIRTRLLNKKLRSPVFHGLEWCLCAFGHSTVIESNVSDRKLSPGWSWPGSHRRLPHRWILMEALFSNNRRWDRCPGLKWRIQPAWKKREWGIQRTQHFLWYSGVNLQGESTRRCRVLREQMGFSSNKRLPWSLCLGYTEVGKWWR